MKRVAIIGAGIAGAGVAYFLGGRAEVTLIEAEAQPGYHTTGRSAAFYVETYGGPDIQPLTTASKPFFDAPPAGFAQTALLSPRGGLHVANAAALPALSALEAGFAGSGVAMERLPPAAIVALAPQLRAEWQAGAIWEPDCRDIDVAALHHGFLAGATRAGTMLMTDARVHTIRRDTGEWCLQTTGRDIRCDVIVNAAGAWGDEVAAMAGIAPLGLQPMRRTVVVVDVDPAPPAHLPLVVAADGSFYFKPDAGRLWVSPHDETPAPPGDCQPEELDVATAIDRLERATTVKIRRIERAWAGLRTFTPNRLPAIGYADDAPGFFWCVGQGGFGIQTAPAASRLAAALVLGDDHGMPGVDADRYLPKPR